MSYAVSITQDGTVLQTARKYIEQDIVVGLSDSIKLPAQTFNPSTADQVIPAGKYLSGAQTIKAVSGTKSITENGTYDVAGFASAAVNVPSDIAAGLQRCGFTIVSDIVVTGTRTSGTCATLLSDIGYSSEDGNSIIIFPLGTVNTSGAVILITGVKYGATSTLSVFRYPDRKLYANATDINGFLQNNIDYRAIFYHI